MAAPSLRFTSPLPGDIVAGEQLIQLAVGDGGRGVERVDVYIGGRLAGVARAPLWSLTANVAPEESGAEFLAVAYSAGQVVAKARVQTRRVVVEERMDVSRVQLYPVVTDRRGRYVASLKEQDFEVLDEGRPVQLKSFSGQPEPLKLTLLLDASRSMSDSLSLVQSASSQFVDRLAERDEVTVYSFNNDLRLLGEHSRDREATKRAIASLRAGGGTALNDAIVRVIDRARDLHGRKALVLFSDGRDERSIASLQRAVAEARRSEMLIYAIGTARGDARYRDFLRTLAEETGGQVHIVRGAADLPDVFDSLLRHLGAQYVMSYVPPRGPAGERRVEVRVRQPGLRVDHKKSYYYRGS
ncbi:MAG: VWA domain-containing protein [Acidobacteria bacterium]|nr:VWA domain-containing protein [Acidobacteriota bacterium]